jgi:hypothetical protein
MDVWHRDASRHPSPDYRLPAQQHSTIMCAPPPALAAGFSFQSPRMMMMLLALQ